MEVSVEGGSVTLQKALPLVVAALYLATGLLHLRRGEYAACGLWVSYAVGNLFIISMANH